MIPGSNVHTHTTFSDGSNSAEEMVLAAMRLGFHTLGFSDHGHTAYDRCGMSLHQEAAYREEIRRLQRLYAGRILFCWDMSTTGCRRRTFQSMSMPSNPSILCRWRAASSAWTEAGPYWRMPYSNTLPATRIVCAKPIFGPSANPVSIQGRISWDIWTWS